MTNLGYQIRNIPNRLREITDGKSCNISSILSAKLIKSDGKEIDFGTICKRIVTDSALTALALSSGTKAIAEFNYHASGTDNTAESASDTALGTEIESRVAGVKTNPSAKVYQSVGTINYTGTHSVTEHGILDANSAGTLLDRSVFTAIPVNSGDSIQFTYQLTLSGS